MNEPLSLEVYALSLAHLLWRRGEPVANVLGSLNITADAFKQAEIFWTQQLEVCLARRQGMLAMKFATAFAEARARVGLLDPTSELASVPSPKPPVAPELPSFLRAQGASADVPGSPWAPPPPPLPQPPAVARSFGRAPDHLRGTALQDPASTPSQALPFQPGPPAAPPPPQRSLPRGPSTGTAMLDGNAPVLQPAMPWEGDVPALTIEQYASLVVELTRRPPNVEQVLTRYGLHSHEQHQRLDAAMKAQFHSDPALRARYDALIMRFATMQVR